MGKGIEWKYMEACRISGRLEDQAGKMVRNIGATEPGSQNQSSRQAAGCPNPTAAVASGCPPSIHCPLTQLLKIQSPKRQCLTAQI